MHLPLIHGYSQFDLDFYLARGDVLLRAKRANFNNFRLSARLTLPLS